jgi:hypothetical protein
LCRRGRVPPKEEDEEHYGPGFDEEEDQECIVNNRRPRGRFGEARNREDNNLGGIKMKIPSFQGRSDPEAYLEWEKKMEFVFDCHNYSETKKVNDGDRGTTLKDLVQVPIGLVTRARAKKFKDGLSP